VNWAASVGKVKEPTIVDVFYNELVHQAVALLAIAALVAVSWHFFRSRPARRAQAGHGAPGPEKVPGLAPREPPARRFFRISFGALWLFDGLLQAQPSMPRHLNPEVVEPSATSSPAWAQHVVNVLVTTWDQHPVTMAVVAVWAQVGVGLWLLACSRGSWSRLGGAASAGWGLGVWVFGEMFGGILAPGLTWLDGALVRP